MPICEALAIFRSITSSHVRHTNASEVMKVDDSIRANFLSVRIPSDLKRELRLMAQAEGVSPSEVVRRAIDEKAERMTVGGASNGKRGT